MMNYEGAINVVNHYTTWYSLESHVTPQKPIKNVINLFLKMEEYKKIMYEIELL